MAYYTIYTSIFVFPHIYLSFIFFFVCRVLGLRKICDARSQMRVHDVPYRIFFFFFELKSERIHFTPHKCENLNRLQSKAKALYTR